MLVHNKPPYTYCGWLSPKQLTCLRLAQITVGEGKGSRGRRGGDFCPLRWQTRTCQTETKTCVHVCV